MRIDDFILVRLSIMSSTHTPHALNRGDSRVTELICSTAPGINRKPASPLNYEWCTRRGKVRCNTLDAACDATVCLFFFIGIPMIFTSHDMPRPQNGG
ncbi:hypothetical protein D1006_39625 [Burkholderia stabilis]|uniref:Uncharacterized protein n=1 Tax=Burkholderia stabilis TaxID=95485 RepID=A0A4Q2A5I4_9BURK|nr:hypothetical protein D1006_39625 [Burkholderia stabilis]